MNAFQLQEVGWNPAKEKKKAWQQVKRGFQKRRLIRRRHNRPACIEAKKVWWGIRILKNIVGFVFEAELVQEQGPGLRPLRRHEWEKKDFLL